MQRGSYLKLNQGTCSSKLFVEMLLASNKSVKYFREFLLEASHNFVKGSAADIIFNFYKYLRKYYEDLLVYQFQLYSDRPESYLILTGIKVLLPDGLVRYYTFSGGYGTDLSSIQDLGGFQIEEIGGVTFEFILSPELKNLKAETENNVNKDLFSKSRQLSVGKGDGTFVTGVFNPEWFDGGLILKSESISVGAENELQLFSLSGGI